MPNPRRVLRLAAAGLLIVASLGRTARACPFCASETGVRVRRAILGPDLWWNLSATIAPFVVLFTLAAWFHFRGPANLRPPEEPE